MYNDTITLFNRKKSKSGDTWYPSVLHNVHVNIDKSSIIAKYGDESKDNAVLHIGYVCSNEKKMIGNKEWITPKEWAKAELPEAALTFTNGSGFDFFWIGDWQGTESIQDNDYDDGFYHYMNSNYDYVFAITSISGPYSVIPHFEITAK